MRDDLGKLAIGTKSDVVLVDLHHSGMMPARGPLRSLVFHAADRAVKGVVAGGKSRRSITRARASVSSARRRR
jgi:cytosine/adenosine deaminase-related metal-dependent hydrolase